MRAVIDIGTNTVLLLIAERGADGRVEVVRDASRITRLGEGVAQSHRLSEVAVLRTLAVLAEYRDVAREHGAELVPVATEGLRLAENREAFLDRANSCLGVAIRVISGDEEATLSYLSVARDRRETGHLRVLDIGGGSTELVVGEDERIVQRCSHRIGSVRLTEELIRHDPPDADEIAAVERAAREALEKQPLEPFPVLHGLAGTVTTAAALLRGLERYDRERVDGTFYPTEVIRELRDRLAREPLAVRVRRSGLEPQRADVIVAGLTILDVALRHCGAETLVVRDRGVRFALV